MIRPLSRNIPSSCNLFVKRSRYCYLTPIQKPITSLAINSIVQLSTQMLTYADLHYGLVPEISIFLGAFAFRTGIEILGLFFQSLNLKQKDSWIYRWLQKIFIVDLKRDATFYELTPNQSYLFAKYYTPQKLFTKFLKSYAMLNFFRGCHSLIYSQTFLKLKESSLMELSMHDPYFVLPVAVIGLTYMIISRSPHPFFIHLVRPQNKFMCLNIAFMVGLIFVPVPSIYTIGYLGLVSSHLFLRSVRQRSTIWKEYLLSKIKKLRPNK